MKNLPYAFALFLLIFSTVSAQTPAAPSPTAQTEIGQLNAEVVKLYTANKLDAALPLAEKVRAQTAALLGSDHEEVITAWKNLAEIQMSLKKSQAAIASFQQAAKLQENKLGTTALPLAATLTRLGVAHFEAGQTEEAEKAFARALAIREAKLPANSFPIAEAAELLGQIYGFKKEWDKASPLYQKSLTIKEALQTNPDDLAITAERYGCTLIKAGREVEYKDWTEKRHQAHLIERAAQAARGEIVAGGVMNGKAVNLPRPDYPNEARRRRILGLVSVKVLLDEQGRVIHACALTGPLLLQEGSETAAYRSSFSPTLLGGKAVKVIGIINYNYVHSF